MHLDSLTTDCKYQADRWKKKRQNKLQIKLNKLWTDPLWLEAPVETILEIRILKPNLGCPSYKSAVVYREIF